MSDVSIAAVSSVLGPTDCEIKAEDLEGGSIFDSDQKRRTFTFVVWPESLDLSLFFKLLQDLHVPVAISPLHNKDLTDDNELKKPHYHVIIRFNSPRYLKPVRQTIGKLMQACSINDEPILGDDAPDDLTWYVQPVHDVPSMVRYLCHLDSPEKASYPVNEVISFGFFDLSPLYAKSVADEVYYYAELIYYVRSHPGITYDKLTNVVFDSQDTGLLRAFQRSSWSIRTYIESVRHTIAEKKEAEKALKAE